jgi:glycosyltransferase involved in cell wall biosynthesis
MKNKQETLVILSPGFPKDEADSTCIPGLQVFVKGLKEICPGLDIIVLAFQYPFRKSEYQWHGVKVISIGGKNNGGFFHLFAWIKALAVLRKLNKTYHLIGLLSFWLGECAFIGSYFAKYYRLYHYCWLVGQDVKSGNKYFNWVKPKGDSLIAMSDFLATQFKMNYNVSPLYVIPFGVDTSLFGAAPLHRDIDILGAGSLIPLKQYHLFIETIGFLKESFPGIKAVICGNGPEMERLQAMAASLHLEKNVTFTGELTHREVLVLMQRSKIFLHPSMYEGFSTVLSEALYAGAQVVSFCKPMEKQFRNHYVVKTNTEMNEQVVAILRAKKIDHQPVLLYPVEHIAKNVISLFV